MFKEHEESRVQKLGIMNDTDGRPAIYYLPPTNQVTAIRNLQKQMLGTMGDKKAGAIEGFKSNQSVFCACGGDNEEGLRKFSRSHNRKSKICMVCGKILPGGVLLGKEREMNLAADRLRVVDKGTPSFIYLIVDMFVPSLLISFFFFVVFKSGGTLRPVFE